LYLCDGFFKWKLTMNQVNLKKNWYSFARGLYCSIPMLNRYSSQFIFKSKNIGKCTIHWARDQIWEIKGTIDQFTSFTGKFFMRKNCCAEIWTEDPGSLKSALNISELSCCHCVEHSLITFKFTIQKNSNGKKHNLDQCQPN
jgi:hypothetical protein